MHEDVIQAEALATIDQYWLHGYMVTWTHAEVVKSLVELVKTSWMFGWSINQLGFVNVAHVQSNCGCLGLVRPSWMKSAVSFVKEIKEGHFHLSTAHCSVRRQPLCISKCREDQGFKRGNSHTVTFTHTSTKMHALPDQEPKPRTNVCCFIIINVTFNVLTVPTIFCTNLLFSTKYGLCWWKCHSIQLLVRNQMKVVTYSWRWLKTECH